MPTGIANQATRPDRFMFFHLHKFLRVVTGAFLFLFVSALASAAGIEELTRLTEQLDKLDKADFQFSLRAGVDCASAREFDCAERQFSKAAKSAVDGKDKRSLADARDLLESYRAQARREELARLREVEERRQQEQARREEEDERVAKQEKYAARVEACEDACADSGQLHLCKTYTIGPSQCNRGSDDNRPNYAAAMLRGLNDSLAGLGQIQRSQNQALGNVLAAIADRERQDQARRDNQRAQQQRSQESEDRAQQRERDRVQRADREAQANAREQVREERGRAQRADQAALERAAALADQQRQGGVVVASNTSSSQQSSASSGFPKMQKGFWDAASLSKKQTEGWCAKWIKQVRDDNKAAKNEMVSVGECECKPDSHTPTNTMTAFETQYYCKFDYMIKMNAPGNSR